MRSGGFFLAPRFNPDIIVAGDIRTILNVKRARTRVRAGEPASERDPTAQAGTR